MGELSCTPPFPHERRDNPCVNTRSKTNVRDVIAIAKDAILFLGGLSGIAYQQVTGNVNFVFLAIFTAMTGIPGLTNLIFLLRGSSTDLPSPLPVQRHSEPESDNATPS